MKLNYMAFTHPHGENFAFHAPDDVAAKKIITEYLIDSSGFRASIHPWDPIKKGWDFAEERSLEIALEEPALPQKREFKLEVRYVKYLNFEGTMTEEEFERLSRRTAAQVLTVLPEKAGWKTYAQFSSTAANDDERYKFGDKIETVTLLRDA